MTAAYTLQYIDKSAMSYAAVFTFRQGMPPRPYPNDRDLMKTSTPTSSRLQPNPTPIPMAWLLLLLWLSRLLPPQRLPPSAPPPQPISRMLHPDMGVMHGVHGDSEVFCRPGGAKNVVGDE